jgi:nucleoside-diphosphate-sugar epimerase
MRQRPRNSLRARLVSDPTEVVIPGTTVFVTGGRGFVGTELCPSLAGRGWDVRSEPLRLMTDPAKWQARLRSTRCVVHLAARAHQMSAGSDAETAYHQVNVEGSRFVAEQAANAGVRRFVFLSSIKVNGDGGPLPYRATDAPDPRDPYGRSKLAAEQVIREVCARSHMEWVIIRPPLVYGPGVKANFRRLMRLVDLEIPLPLGSIENRRSLVGLTNLGRFIETCMIHPEAAGQVWLIADDECISTPELLSRLSQHMNRRSRLFPFSPLWLRRLAATLHVRAELERLSGSLQVDASPARVQLGWHPTSSLDGELARTVAAFRIEQYR